MTGLMTESEALCRLLYTSQCALEGSPCDKLAEIRKIAQSAAGTNRLEGLTGGLLFVDNTFIQVIEGPAANLEAAFERICCDLRHSELTIIEFGPVKSRMFANWEMAFMADGEDIGGALRGDLADISLLIRVNAREAERQMRDLLIDKAA